MPYQITLDLYELFFAVIITYVLVYYTYRTYMFCKYVYASAGAEYSRLMREYEEIKRTVVTAANTINRYDQRFAALRTQNLWTTLYQTYLTPLVTVLAQRYLGGNVNIAELLAGQTQNQRHEAEQQLMRETRERLTAQISSLAAVSEMTRNAQQLAQQLAQPLTTSTSNELFSFPVHTDTAQNAVDSSDQNTTDLLGQYAADPSDQYTRNQDEYDSYESDDSDSERLVPMQQIVNSVA